MGNTNEIYKNIESKLSRTEVISLMYCLKEQYNIKVNIYDGSQYSNGQSKTIFS